MAEMGVLVAMLLLLRMALLERCVSLVGGGFSGRSEEGMVQGRAGMGVGGVMSC
jgi:hypothetical protein